MKKGIVSLCIGIGCIAVVWVGNVTFVGHVLLTFTALVCGAYGCTKVEGR